MHHTVKEMVATARETLNSKYGKDIGELLADLMANVDNPGVQLQALKEFNDRAYGKPDAKISVQMGENMGQIYLLFADVLGQRLGADAVPILDELKAKMELAAANADRTEDV